MSKKLTDTGERMIPEFHKGTLIYAEHLTRYRALRHIVKDKVVLDIASGSGYGSALLSETASLVYGVDVDEDAVAYSKDNFGGPKTKFIVGTGTKIP